MNATTALETAKGLMEKGMSLNDANIEIVRMMGVRIVHGKFDKRTRAALNQGVKEGRIGHLKKDKFKPEAYFHPNSKWRAMDMRAAEASQAIQAIAKIHVKMSEINPA